MLPTQCGKCWKIPCEFFRLPVPGRLSDHELRQLSNDELTELLLSASKIVKERLTVARTSSSTYNTPISLHNLHPNVGVSEDPKNA